MPRIRIPTPLQPLTGNLAELQLAAGSLRELIEDLERRHPGAKARLCDAEGKLRRFLNVYVNEADVRSLKGLDTPVGESDEVSIVPAIAGGLPGSGH